jgi:MYXO-CTERM domain-containing protein
MATAWSPPATTERAFSAFKLFRNYDGNGSAFESVGVRATVAGSGVQAFAATGTKRLTVVLVNEGGAATTANVSIAGFDASGAAEIYSNDGSADISRKADATVTSGAVSVSLPATSISMLVFGGDNPNSLPDAGTGFGGTGGNTGSSNGGASNTTGGSSGASGSGASGASGANGGGSTGTGAGGVATGAGGGTAQSQGQPLTSSGSSANDKSGCGCRTTTSDAPAGGSLLAFAALFGFGARRRRRPVA